MSRALRVARPAKSTVSDSRKRVEDVITAVDAPTPVAPVKRTFIILLDDGRMLDGRELA